MNKRSSKAMMILLLVFLLLATANLFLSLVYQIGRPENRYGLHIPPHDSNDPNDRAIYIDGPIAKECKVILAGVVTVSIGFIVFAIYCNKCKLYGRMQVVTIILTLVYWAAGEFVIWM